MSLRRPRGPVSRSDRLVKQAHPDRAAARAPRQAWVGSGGWMGSDCRRSHAPARPEARSVLRHRLVAMRYSQVRSDGAPLEAGSRPSHAESRVSCNRILGVLERTEDAVTVHLQFADGAARPATRTPSGHRTGPAPTDLPPHRHYRIASLLCLRISRSPKYPDVDRQANWAANNRPVFGCPGRLHKGPHE